MIYRQQDYLDLPRTPVFVDTATSSFPDSSAFGVFGTSLHAAVSFNFEVKDGYTICVGVTDNGSPSPSGDELFMIAVNDLNDPPDRRTGRPQRSSRQHFVHDRGLAGRADGGGAGNVLTFNDSDEDAGDTISVVAETVLTANGDIVVLAANASFTDPRHVPDTPIVGLEPVKGVALPLGP